ncbi:MAG TPA: hypothetical protein VJB67_02850 [Patescibacteria group bacterium]|nr:hypothetical protein [Patescibacteria group bacterium]
MKRSWQLKRADDVNAGLRILIMAIRADTDSRRQKAFDFWKELIDGTDLETENFLLSLSRFLKV